jgi:hypothetical protein
MCARGPFPEAARFRFQARSSGARRSRPGRLRVRALVSVNTVKANLKNIYAKLGVSSRAETVERARLLGLL